MNPREMTPEDHEQVDRLVQSSWGNNVLMLSQYRVHRGDWPVVERPKRTSLVVCPESEIVGVGTVFESTLHPRMYLVAINVSRAWQRQGVGSCLYSALAHEASDKPWMVKLSRGDQAGRQFLQKRGFTEVADTWMGVLDPTEAATQVWLADLPGAVNGFEVLPLTECAATVTREQFAHELAQVYAQHHQWNPPSTWPPERVLEVFAGSATIAGSELCLLKDGRLIGAGVLFRDKEVSAPNEAYLVHVGVVDQPPVAAARLTHLLIRHEIEIAGRLKMRVRFEADREYIPHRQAFSSAPLVEVNHELYVMAGPPTLEAG
jgi:GNAT superfamily N-acetyltransferase